MTYGLLSALSWGVSTLLAAVAARRIGTLRTVVLGEAAGMVGYLILFYLGHFSLRGVGSTAWLLILGGVIGVGAISRSTAAWSPGISAWSARSPRATAG